MRELKRWAWVAVVAAAWAAPAHAQLTGNAGTGTTGTGSTGTGTIGTGGISAGSTGGTGGGSGTQGSQLQNFQLQNLQAPPDLGVQLGNATSSLDRSNFLSGYYANPYYQGRITAQRNQAPGGFGLPSFETTGTGAVRGGTARGAAGGLGRTGGTSAQNLSGIVVPLPVQINYTAEIRFAAPPMAPTRLQADLRAAIDGTSMIASAKGVQVVTDEGNNVTLRGTVADDDERRLIEGVVRLTPGVRGIKNELTLGTPTAGK